MREKAPWSKMHRRKDSTFYKWDIPLKKLESGKVGLKIKTLEDFHKSYEGLKQDILKERRCHPPIGEI